MIIFSGSMLGNAARMLLEQELRPGLWRISDAAEADDQLELVEETPAA